jgi:hypothetical protein
MKQLDENQNSAQPEDPRSAPGGQRAGGLGSDRRWSTPTITTFNVAETQGIFFGSSDGINNLTNEG